MAVTTNFDLNRAAIALGNQQLRNLILEQANEEQAQRILILEAEVARLGSLVPKEEAKEPSEQNGHSDLERAAGAAVAEPRATRAPRS